MGSCTQICCLDLVTLFPSHHTVVLEFLSLELRNVLEIALSEIQVFFFWLQHLPLTRILHLSPRAFLSPLWTFFRTFLEEQK